MRVCICGGGNLGHVVAGFLAAQEGVDVSVLTRNPERWSDHLAIEVPSGHGFTAKLAGVYADARQALDGADLVLLCLPGYSIRQVLLQMKACLHPQTPVGSIVSSTGFFFEAMSLLPSTTPLFGFQRVPFIARTLEYGRRARLMGFKKSLRVAIEQTANPESLRCSLEQLLKTPVELLHNFYEASLSNSNPLLHPARLYDLWEHWHAGEVYSRIPLFYEEWSEHAAQLYIAMDNELQHLLGELPVAPGSIPTVLDYYESKDEVSLARKLRSIEAFKGIRAPMREVAGGFVPDLSSRYFIEDFPYGLGVVQRLAHDKHVDTPTIDRIMDWSEHLSATVTRP